MQRTPAATRRTPSLQEEAQARATEAFNRRTAELKELAPLLARLDELRPALADQGCTLYTDNISLHTERLLGGFSGPRSKVLRLMTNSWYDKAKPHRFIEALQGLGLKIVSTTPGPYGSALLRKGPLLLRVDLADPDTAPVVGVLHCAAGQVADTARANPDATVVCTTAANGQPLPGGYAMAAQPAVDFANRDGVPA